MIRFIKLILLGLLSVLLLGCINSSRYHGAYGANSYMKNAATIPPITVPQNIPSPVADQLYPVPWTASGKATPKISLVPPDPNYQHYLWEQKQANKKKKDQK